jgi:NTP pyrophosphatase (non-canonical NTP hydrolase)
MNAPKQAVQVWGISAQLSKLAEECCELAVAAHHVERGAPADLEALFEEMADVEIVLEGIRPFYGDDKVDAYRLKKLTRLERRIAKTLPPDAEAPKARGGMVTAKAVSIGGDVFPSITQAAEYLGMHPAELRDRLKAMGSFEHMGVTVAFEASA